MAVYSLFRGMIKRIAFVRCGRKLTVFKRVPRLNVNKAIMLLILNFLYQNGLFLLNHNQNEKVVELLLKYMVFFVLCNLFLKTSHFRIHNYHLLDLFV